MIRLLRDIGVRGRLLLAFLGISGLAVLGAVAALLQFSEVEAVLDHVTKERMPASLAALELSRQAERIASAAPRLLADRTEVQQLQTDGEIRSELSDLDRLLAVVKISRPDSGLLSEIEGSVLGIRDNLAQLQTIVSTRFHRLDKERAELLRRLAQVAEDGQWTLEGWSRQFDTKMAQFRNTMADPSLSEEARRKAMANLVASIGSVQPVQVFKAVFTGMHNTLAQAATASDTDLPHLAFLLSKWGGDISGALNNLGPGLRSDLAEPVKKLRALGDGPGSIPEFRSQELALIAEAEKLLQNNTDASARLSAAVNRLVEDSRSEIANAEADVATTQRRSASVLIAVVALSLLSSALIVWLYVGRSLIGRLTALSDSMLAIAEGQLRAPLPAPGHDEIGRMADALRIFRDTAVEVEDMNLRERQVVLDTIEYGVLILDSELRVKMHNRAFRDLWGVSEDELRGQPSVRELLETYRSRGVHGVPEEEWSAYVERRIAEIAAADILPQEWQRPDGRVLQYGIVPLPDGGRMLTYFDLTHVKRVEAELRARVDELRRLGEELASASKHKSQFLANMSHELRTPLNAILGYTELILDGIYGETPEKMRSVLERVSSNGKHLLGLINDVLDLSKIEAGQLRLSLADYALDGVVQTVFTAVEPLAAEKHLDLRTEVARDLPAGHGDERRLTQVLLNLVGNAIKFTNEGEVVIKAGALNGSFEVTVRDTGPGIALADQAKIFEEFQQADSSSTRKKGGTGLGLSISKRIIEMHGGRLWVESEPGHGAAFTFTVPVAARSEAHPS